MCAGFSCRPGAPATGVVVERVGPILRLEQVQQKPKKTVRHMARPPELLRRRIKNLLFVTQIKNDRHRSATPRLIT
jgi:hypothetical protein